MNRIIIATNSLSKDKWTCIYRFIKSIVINDEKSKLSVFEALNRDAKINIVLDDNGKDRDMVSLEGEEITTDNISIIPSTDVCFNILYEKSDDSEDFIELMPFVLLQDEFGDIISLGIDLQRIESDSERLNGYLFKCSNFFILQDHKKPQKGKRDLYFIRGNSNNKGEINPLSPYPVNLAGKKEHSVYEGIPNRRFLPLIRVSENNFQKIFGVAIQDSTSNTKDAKETNENANVQKPESSDKELQFITSSINKLRDGFKKIKSPSAKKELDTIFNNTNSLFGQWLESGYFYAYDDELKLMSVNDLQGIRNTLQIYKSSIFELVQNIMFHGGKKGLLYCAFAKKDDISNSFKHCIPHFEQYQEDNRFLRIGIFDFNKEGITDTFHEEQLELKDFFNPHDISITGLTHLDMRYAASLGIKTFVKTVLKHDGYFSVESNEKRKNHIVKNRLITIYKDNEVMLSAGSEPINYVNGTHYEIILPLIATEPNQIVPLQKESGHLTADAQYYSADMR